MAISPLVAFRLDSEAERILNALTESEQRSRSDILRRAIRMYGERAGLVTRAPVVKPVTVSSPKPRAKRVKA